MSTPDSSMSTPDEDFDPIADLLDALTLRDSGARTTEEIVTVRNQWMPHGRIYGGQVLAQSVIAASRTVTGDRTIHSLHGYFLRPGLPEQPTTLAVDRIHDGRSFATRRTQAFQQGEPIFSMIASFQDDDPGVDHQAELPAGIPDPDSLPALHEMALPGDPRGEAMKSISRRWPFEMRHVPDHLFTGPSTNDAAHQVVWIRAVGPLPDDPLIHRAALAYASDFTILEPVLRRHGLSWAHRGMRVASLDHAMWWHRFGRVDQWLAYVQESPNARGGRGLSLGRIYTRDGELLATVAQEGMVRVPQD